MLSEKLRQISVKNKKRLKKFEDRVQKNTEFLITEESMKQAKNGFYTATLSILRENVTIRLEEWLKENGLTYNFSGTTENYLKLSVKW